MKVWQRVRRPIKRIPAARKLMRFGWSLQKHGAVRAASAIAFDAFLSLIPLLAMAGWVLHQTGQEAIIVQMVFDASPISAKEVGSADPLRLSSNAVMTVAPLSASVFLWLSSSGIATAMGVSEVMFEAERRVWWRRRLIAIAWVIGGLITVSAATYLVLTLSRFVGGRGATLMMAPLVVPVVILFFRTSIKRPRGMRRHVWPGALLTVGLWAAMNLMFTSYVQSVARYSLFYGSLATVAMLMLWLWLLAMALLIGGELNAQLEGVREFPPSTTLEHSPLADHYD